MPTNRMLIVDRRRGLVEVEVPTGEARSLVGKHHSAIGRYLETGDEGRLRALKGKAFLVGPKLYELETDPETIEQLALAGDLGYEDIYVLE